MREQDLWHVRVVLRYQEWRIQEVSAHYLIRTADAVAGNEAARLACLQVMYRSGLPNGEFAYAIDGSAHRMEKGALVLDGEHSLIRDPGEKVYRHSSIKGEKVGPDPKNAEMIQYNWNRDRWDGKS